MTYVKMEFKSYDVQVKAEGDQGVVEAIVSVFGNIDSYGDRMLPGSFANTLNEWAAKGDPIPFIFSHQWDDPTAYLGAVVDARETDEGLYVKAQLDMEQPETARTFKLLKNRLVTQFSFGYITRDYEMVNDPTFGEVREIKDVQLIEVGPTLLGANQSTRLIQAASATLAAQNTSEQTEPVAEQEQVVADVRDSESNIDTERLVTLLTRPMNSEE